MNRGMKLEKIRHLAARRGGRPRRNDLDTQEIRHLRDEENLSWRQIARRLRAGVTTVRRIYGLVP